MSNLTGSLYSVRLLDDLARRESPIHKLHPLAKLITTVAYLAVVISFDRTAIVQMLPLLFYPLMIFAIGDVPFSPILKRILYVEPFILAIGVLNPVFDRTPVLFANAIVSQGWLTFIALCVKSILTVTAALLLIATTGMDKLGGALRQLKVPRLFVLQLQMTYRYLAVLLEEASRLTRAYSLRSNGQRGIVPGAWGSLAGGLLLRTLDRAQRVYQAMLLRGFSGEYRIGAEGKFSGTDLLYAAGCTALFVSARIVDLPTLIGSLLTGA